MQPISLHIKQTCTVLKTSTVARTPSLNVKVFYLFSKTEVRFITIK